MFFLTISAFIKGFIIGVSIAAPVGPIGIICIRKTINSGKMSGFVTGMGAAFADTFYAIAAAFSVALITNFLKEHTVTIRVIGGIVLIFIGTKIIYNSSRLHATLAASGGTKRRLLKDFFSTFLLTLTNPGTIFSFIAIFAGIGLSEYQDIHTQIILVTGVFAGSLSWWLFLSNMVSLARKRITNRTLRYINLTSGSLIVAFGIAVLVSLIYIS